METNQSSTEPQDPSALPQQATAGGPNPDYEHILQFFEWKHPRAELAEISMPFGTLALHIARVLPRNPERSVALRKLLEAKDAAVRARIAK